MTNRHTLLDLSTSLAVGALALALRAGFPIPQARAANAPEPTSSAAVAALDPDPHAISLNHATVEQLTQVDGVDEALAKQIVALREQRGRLGSVEALRVLDIQPDVLDNLRRETVIELPISAVNEPKHYNSVAEVMATFKDEPDVRTVQAMAMTYAKTNPELVEAWMDAAKRGYLLPRVDLQYQKKLNLKNDYIYVADASGSTQAQLDESSGDNDDTYEIKLQWQLNKLLMSSERIRVINEAQDIVKLRDKVLDEVTRLYFDRRRQQIDMLLNPPATLQDRIKAELQLEEVTANLDAYTGGAFSAALPKK